MEDKLVNLNAILSEIDRWIGYLDEDMILRIKTGIKRLSSVTPERKGHWIEERNNYEEIQGWHCDKCYEDSGFTTKCKWDFCPNCGANMRGDEDGNK